MTTILLGKKSRPRFFAKFLVLFVGLLTDDKVFELERLWVTKCQNERLMTYIQNTVKISGGHGRRIRTRILRRPNIYRS